MVTKKTSATKKVSKKAAGVEDRRLRDYELVMIVKPELEEEKYNSIIDNITQFITSREGTVANIDRWGKRKLAYPIKHFLEGNYVLARFKVKPTLSKELEAHLKISEEILRHLLVRVE